MAILKVKLKYIIGITVLTTLGCISAIFLHHQASSCYSIVPVLYQSIGPSNALSITRRSNEGIGLRNERSSHGYVLSVHFNGQQSAGVRSLTSLQCWVGLFNLPMYVVEPFIDESVVHGIADKSKGNPLRLRNFFDFDRYNERSKELGHRELASWEDFMDHAPRNVIIIHTKRKCYANHKPRAKVVWIADHVEQCGRTVELNKSVLVTQGFCVKKIIEFAVFCNTDIILTGEDLYRYVFDIWNPSEVTLVIDYWTGSWHVPTSWEARLDSKCKDSHESGLSGKLYPSQQLLDHSQRYENMYTSDGRRFSVAVMLRSEHLVNNLNRRTIESGFSHCLDEIDQSVVPDAAKESRNEPFVTSDVGRFGSDSNVAPYRLFDGGRKTVNQPMKELTVKVFGRNLTFEEWEDTFPRAAEGITDRGYIAALQRTIASRADCLVLVGGGQFPKFALHQYLDFHTYPNQWCIRYVCVLGKFKAEYDDIIAQRRIDHRPFNHL